MATIHSSPPPSAVSNPHLTNQIRSWAKSATNADKWLFQQSLVSTVSYLTVGTIAVCSITAMFFFFIMVTMVDDMLRLIAPSRLWDATQAHRQWLQLDWAALVDRVRVQLNQFAAWERRKRAEWVSSSQETEEEDINDPFYSLVSAVSNYLDDYTRHNRRQFQTK